MEGAPQESAFPLPSTQNYTGSQSTLVWNDPSGTGLFSATETSTISSVAAGVATVQMDMTITNTGAAPLTLHLFQMIDPDVNGSAGADSATQPTAGVPLIRITDATTGFFEYAAPEADDFLVLTFGASTDVAAQLSNATVTEFASTGVPFGPGDATVGWQWRALTIAPGASRTVTAVLASNEPAGVTTAPQFGYIPTAGSTVAFTGGSLIGSTASASIAVDIATAGAGSGAAATTTTTCSVPAGFSGFDQTVTATGNAATTSGGPLAGNCVLGASAVTATLNCNEVRGTTSVPVAFELSCPAGIASADLGITKTNNTATVTQGAVTSYSIVASNAGPDSVTGATVVDMFPAACSAVSWSCVGAGGGTCTAAGTGNIGDTVNLPAGANVTYTASCTVGAAAVGDLTNTATVAVPAGASDPAEGNDSATDGPDAIVPPNVAPAFAYTPPAGSTVTFTGGGAIGSTATASIGVAIGTAGSGTGAAATTTTTCVAPAGFSGFGQTVTAEGAAAATSGGPLAGSCVLGAAEVTQTLQCNENRGGTEVPVSFTLTCPSGSAVADLSITKTNGVGSVTPGGSSTYTITASNAGPDAATGATVSDLFPAACSSTTWTCVGAGGGTCTAAGSGNIGDTVNLPAGGSVTYTATCSIGAAATGTLSNTATVTAPASANDPAGGNNSATDGPDTIAAANLAPVFAYTPPAGGGVTFTGGGAIGSTATGSIAVSIGTAGSGSGATATTTTTCAAPAGFSGFTQTVTASGDATATSGGPLQGTCVRGATATTGTLACSENQGGTVVARNFTLTCPAGSAALLTSTPPSGTTLTLPQQAAGGAATTASVGFQNPGLVDAVVSCTVSGAPAFTVAPASVTVAPSGTASVTVTFNSAVAGNFTGNLSCTAGAQTFDFPLAGSAGVAAPAAAPVTIPTLLDGARAALMLLMLGLGLITLQRLRR